MAIDLSKARQSPRHAGVYIQPSGQLVARAVVRLPDGKVKTLLRTLPAGASEAMAVQIIEELKELARNPPAPPVTPLPHPQDIRQTVEDFCERWLCLRSKRLKPSAAQTYMQVLSRHVLPRLGHLACVEVNRQVLEAWVVWAEAKKPPCGKPSGKKGIVQPATGDRVRSYSHDTLRQWWRVLSTVMKDMAADLNLPDPTCRVRPPSRPQEELRREQRTLDADDLVKLVNAAKVHAKDRYAEIALLCLTGMRAGELYALKWDCIDLDRGEILVKRSISLGKLTETTKTKSQRTVPLHPTLVDLLPEHRRSMVADQVPGVASGLVFPSSNGTARTAHSLDRAFTTIAKEMGTDLRIGAQVLRRSMNSNLLRQAVDRLTIRSIMGHTSEQMTSRYYGATSDEKLAAVLKLSVVRGTGTDDK